MWSLETPPTRRVAVMKVFERLKVVSFLLLVAMPFAPSSVLAPSSKARSPQ